MARWLVIPLLMAEKVRGKPVKLTGSLTQGGPSWRQLLLGLDFRLHMQPDGVRMRSTFRSACATCSATVQKTPNLMLHRRRRIANALVQAYHFESSLLTQFIIHFVLLLIQIHSTVAVLVYTTNPSNEPSSRSPFPERAP